jgi:hypothetical protein
MQCVILKCRADQTHEVSPYRGCQQIQRVGQEQTHRQSGFVKPAGAGSAEQGGRNDSSGRLGHLGQ